MRRCGDCARNGCLGRRWRRVRDCRVRCGPDREVHFEQVAVPGREAAFDFTNATDLGVTIRGVPFPHLLFEWVLSCSTWTYVALAFSETFEALVACRARCGRSARCRRCFVTTICRRRRTS